MGGESNLEDLIQKLHPVLNEGEFVFCSQPVNDIIPAGCHPLGTFQEKEGLTIILPRAEADRYGWKYDYIAAWITLTVHSDLAAVGLTAAVSKALAQTGISCNVVAGFYHDHLFVSYSEAQNAVEILSHL